MSKRYNHREVARESEQFTIQTNMGLAELRRSVDLKERMASKTIHIGRNSGTLKVSLPLVMNLNFKSGETVGIWFQ